MKLFLQVSLGLFLFSSCTQNKNQSKSLSLIQDAQKIISTRGSDEAQFFALIKLKSPALLEKAKRVNGVTVIDVTLKSQIEAEQVQAIQDLQKLSSSVQVVYRYKMVLNAVAVVGPRDIFEKLNQIGLIASWEKVGNFQRAIVEANTSEINGDSDLTLHNSAKFIGAEALNQLGLTGKGIKVGVIDTGVDYTHVMFGGAGTEAAYKSVDPSTANNFFPNSKVVGGVDLVGTDYNAASADYDFHIPKPDLNPIDEAAHGSHVAGTIAGRGDLVDSYNGMAPDADLYAIKVFGADGSTSDMVVIAGLEFSADPNGDGILDDQLDVVNLSLGSSYGTQKLLYAEALKNLVLGGTSAIISAGNSGNSDYIVGSPGTSTEALSVASSIDDTEHNWKFKTSTILLGSLQPIYVEAIEAATTASVDQSSIVGDFYYLGVADKDLTADQAAGVQGKVALIDRGVVNFNDKVRRAADAGAIGVVVMNNQAGAAFKMGTTDKFNIPAIMITQDIGKQIKASLNGEMFVAGVGVEFKANKKIEKPELIDTISSFSSKGPRSIDGYLKPEITAPGSNIISAAFGTGNKFIQMSGTSMAAPHMTGVMVLLKQSFKNKGYDLSAIELKNIAMGNAKTLSEAGKVYPITRQGAGRIEATAKTINSPMVIEQSSISMGEVGIFSKRQYRQKIDLKSLSQSSQNLAVTFEGHPGVRLVSPNTVSLAAGQLTSATLNFELDASFSAGEIEEFDGLVKFLENGQEVYRLPLLAVVHKQAIIKSQATLNAATQQVTLDIKNTSNNDGQALFFNLLATDARKPQALGAAKNIMNTDCDLQSAGYRILNKKDDKGNDTQYLQFAFKIYKPLTSWTSCDLSVLFDHDQDGKIDQELVGTRLKSIAGQASSQMSSILIDTGMARQLRLDFEREVQKAKGKPKELEKVAEMEDYTTAIQDVGSIFSYNNSTLSILEIPLDSVVKGANDNLHFKLLSTYYSGNPVEFDDYLVDTKATETFTISALQQQQPFYGFIDERSSNTVAANGSAQVTLNQSKNVGELVAYYPQNIFTFSDLAQDRQSQVVPLK